MTTKFEATTICAVRQNGHNAMAGDGQVTMGEKVVMKGTAHKVRRIYNDQVVVGFAGVSRMRLTLKIVLKRNSTNFLGIYNGQPLSLPRNGAVTRRYRNWKLC